MAKLKTVKPDVDQGDTDLGLGPVVSENSTVVSKNASSDSQTTPVVSQTTPVVSSPDDDSQFWEQLQIVGSMCEIERQRMELQQEIEEKDAEVKSAKAALKKIESDLKELKEDLNGLNEQIFTFSRELLTSSTGQQLPTRKSEQAKQEEGWRLRSTSDLLSGLKGFSKKKLDALVELAPTVGHLEDLRGEASRSHAEFSEKLPKGIGKGVAQEIENRLMDHIAEYAKAQADPDRIKLADELLAEVRESADQHRWDESDCVPTQDDDEHIHAGYAAFMDGKPHTAFISMDRDKARQWMIGWVGAERLKRLRSDAA